MAAPPKAPAALAFARTCYDHLAGVVGVAVFDSMVDRGWLCRAAGPTLGLTDQGERGLAGLGIDVEICRAARRPLARPCTDWTERRPHLAGALGAAMTRVMLDQGWLRRAPAGRGLILTDLGASLLAEHFDVHPGVPPEG